MRLNFNHNFVSFFAKNERLLIDFTRVYNFSLSSEYSVFNLTLTYILCAITPMLYSKKFIISAFYAAVYFLFNNLLVGVAVTTSLSVWEVRVRLSSRLNRTQTVSPANGSPPLQRFFMVCCPGGKPRR